jgi:oligosaccharide repeat unit polymerase
MSTTVPLDGRLKSSPAVLILAGLTFVLATTCAAAAAASGHALTLLALLVCMVAVIPILINRGQFDLFSPWNYLFYFVILNVLVRSLLIDFEITGNRVNLDATFFLRQPPEFMLWSMALMLFGFSFLVLGYLIPLNRAMPLDFRIFRGLPFHPRRLRRMLIVTLLLSMAAFVAFVAATFQGAGEFAWRMLSSHRGLSSDLADYQAYGYLRLLVGLSNLVVYIAYAQSRLTDSVRARRFYRRVMALGLLVSVAMAFYSQSRAALVFAFLNIVFIKYYLDRQRFPIKLFAVVAPLGVALFMLTSMLRGGTGVSLADRITPMTVIAPMILTTGGIDASKTGHIVDYVDDTQDFKLGGTLVQFITAVVPRSLWPGKPVNLDTYIGEKIYGAQFFGSSAVPAGYFGEMYMNFWYAGIVLGALVLGMLIKVFSNLLAGNKRSVGFILCYVVMLQQFGMSVLGSGVSSTIIGALSAGVPMIIALCYVTPRSRRTSASPASSQSANRVSVG